ncbi:hypothetical protein GBAR_LOCUS14030 [Geodia barretti]|uniref:DNA helicase n=1 Tax=Geodia barretti TaxID=519541 RepID=A0AA35WRN2_GEOBA|nr:hypothetical protein GBAR_LOCUS14030 [Geodia barretti]
MKKAIPKKLTKELICAFEATSNRDIDEAILDDAARHIIESVSDTSSTMLQKVSDDDVSSYQSYTIRRLDQKEQNVPDTDQECGLYEASDLLLGDHLCEKSTTIKWIDVSLSQNRNRRLRNHSKLVEIREMNPDSTDTFEENLVDDFYPKRPDDMEEICLYDSPNLIEEGETAESAFERHLEENDALNTHSEKLQRMLMARERVQKINEARRAQQEDVGADPGPVEDDEGPQVAGEATSAINDVLDLHQNNESDGPTLEELVQSLNTDQARVYEHVKSLLEHQLTHEIKQCSCTDLKPLHMFVSGVGGTGKSFLIKTVRALVTKMWECETQSTGLAA